MMKEDVDLCDKGAFDYCGDGPPGCGYLCVRRSSTHKVKKCPNCGNQFPISFDSCIYCKADLREIEPTEHIPIGTPLQRSDETGEEK